jgi:large subunit ribosomal protein L18
MTVFRSNSHMYIQVIDDVAGTTLVAASSLEADLKGLKNTVEDAAKLGELLGKRMLEKNIDTCVFDRNGYLFHGIVKSIADGARKAGVRF